MISKLNSIAGWRGQESTLGLALSVSVPGARGDVGDVGVSWRVRRQLRLVG
jgi:hypothetical protein